jgi:HK97 family phage major capsid protein
VNPNRSDPWADLTASAMMASARRPARRQAPVPAPAGDGGEALGAKLDGYPWARSWGSFLNAIGGRDDATGAQAVIRRVMEEGRPRDAFSERVPADGGLLVPERLRQQVLAYMTAAVVRPEATIITMDSLRVPIPVLDNPSQSGSAQALGGLTFAITEAAAPITPTTADFARLALEAHKAAAYLQSVPNELCDDSPAFGDFLARVAGAGYAWFEDDLFIGTGTGIGEPQALLNAPGALAVTRTTGGKVVHLDIVTMLKGLHPASKAKATWLLSTDAFDQLLELYEIDGTAPAGQDIPPPGTLKFNSQSDRWELLGLGAAVTDHQPAVGTAGDVMLADLSLYLIGDRQELTVERSGGSGFVSDTSNFRIRSRIDGRFWPQQTYTTTAGQPVAPLVVLN